MNDEKERDVAREYYRAHEHESYTASTISMFELAFGVVWDGTGDLETLRESLQWVDFLDFSVPDTIEGRPSRRNCRPPAIGYRSAIC